MSTSSEDHERPLMAAVNEAIDRLHSSLALPDSVFFCECGHPSCRERITLSRAEYSGLLSRPLLAPIHADHVRRLEGTLVGPASIERAKAVLVESHGLTPDEAFALLRQHARDERRSLDEVCAQIVKWSAGMPPDDVRPEPAPAAAAPATLESHER